MGMEAATLQYKGRRALQCHLGCQCRLQACQCLPLSACDGLPCGHSLEPIEELGVRVLEKCGVFAISTWCRGMAATATSAGACRVRCHGPKRGPQLAGAGRRLQVHIAHVHHPYSFSVTKSIRFLPFRIPKPVYAASERFPSLRPCSRGLVHQPLIE